MKNFLKILTFLILSFNLNNVFAGTIDHFQVEFSKNSASTLESLDLTIKAVDKNNDIVKDYTWNILWISQTDDWVELPAELASDQWYSFQLSDQWVKKFENWVKFSTAWEQSISIYDTNDYENLTGIWKITIVENNTSSSKTEIEILSPDSNTTLPDNKVKVSWATKKNYQVRIELNNSKEFTTTSNSDWIFEKEIDWLATWENILKAYILDSDENIIWESSEVIVKIDNAKPKFKKITLSPISESGSVEEGTNVDIKVFASKWLKSAKVLFNDWVIGLSETEDWIYTWKFKAPSKDETFPIDVLLSDNLGHITTEKNAASIKVKLVETNSAQTEEPVKTEKKPELSIKWLKLVKLKTKSILTWDKAKDAESYDVFKKNDETWDFEFLKNVTEPKFEIEITWDKIKYQYFAVKAKTKTASWELITWDLSEATKIQTWPTEIILMLLLSLILGFGFMLYKRKNA